MGFNLVGPKEIQCSLEDQWLSQTNLRMKTVHTCQDSYNVIGCPKDRVVHPVYALYGYEFEKPNSECKTLKKAEYPVS